MRYSTFPCLAATAIFFAFIAVRLDAAPAPAAFPITVTKDGVTVTITDASWANNGDGERGLLVHYRVTGNTTVPFRVSAANTRCIFQTPTGDAINDSRFDGTGAFNTNISPNWKCARILFHVHDLNATSADTEGISQETLTWPAIPVPAKLDVPVNIGLKQTTSHGTVVTLEKMILKTQPTGQGVSGEGRNPAYFVFSAIPSPKIGGLTIYVGQQVNVYDENCKKINNYSGGWVQNFDWIDQVSSQDSSSEKFLKLGASEKTLTVSDIVNETSKTFLDTRAYRDVPVSVPLIGLSLPASTGPEVALGHMKVGSLDATLESLGHDQFSQWTAVFWLNRTPDAPSYAIEKCDIDTDSGANLSHLDNNNITYSSNQQTMWKANGAAPAPGEIATTFRLWQIQSFPTTAKSLTITATAVAEPHYKRQFAFHGIPVPAQGSFVNLSLAAAAAPSTVPLPASAMGTQTARMTITQVRREPVTEYMGNAGKQIRDRCQIYYRIDYIPYDPKWRTITLSSINDDQGRAVSCNNVASTTFGDSTSFIIDAPAAGAKTLNINLTVDDTIEEAPPVKFVFSGVPVPVDTK